MVDRDPCRTLGCAAALVAGLLMTSCTATHHAPDASAGFARPVWERAAGDGTGGLAAPGRTAGTVGAWSTNPMPVTLPRGRWQEDEEPQDRRHVTAMMGARLLDDDWDPVDDQLVLGVEFDSSDPDHGHGFEAGFLIAGDEDDVGANDIYTATTHVYGGWRKTFRQQKSGIHPYVAAGLAVLWTAYEVDTPVGDIDDDDVEPGAYVRVGVLFDVGSRMRCGVDYRHVFADDFELSGVDYEGDFDQILITFGFAF